MKLQLLIEHIETGYAYKIPFTSEVNFIFMSDQPSQPVYQRKLSLSFQRISSKNRKSTRNYKNTEAKNAATVTYPIKLAQPTSILPVHKLSLKFFQKIISVYDCVMWRKKIIISAVRFFMAWFRSLVNCRLLNPAACRESITTIANNNINNKTRTLEILDSTAIFGNSRLDQDQLP